MRVTILHLDLGIGGAEQLIVNVATVIKELGHEVTILTSHHDPSHCFEETKPTGMTAEFRTFRVTCASFIANYYRSFGARRTCVRRLATSTAIWKVHCIFCNPPYAIFGIHRCLLLSCQDGYCCTRWCLRAYPLSSLYRDESPVLLPLSRLGKPTYR